MCKSVWSKEVVIQTRRKDSATSGLAPVIAQNCAILGSEFIATFGLDTRCLVMSLLLTQEMGFIAGDGRLRLHITLLDCK